MIFSKFTISKLGCEFSKYQLDCLVQIFAQVFEIDFFFKASLPPDASRLRSNNKSKSPASIIFLLESKQKSSSS